MREPEEEGRGVGGTRASTPHSPRDPGFRPLCLSTHEIKHRVTEMHRQGWAYKMCHFCNPVLALKKYWEPKEANKSQLVLAHRDLRNAWAPGQRE